MRGGDAVQLRAGVGRVCRARADVATRAALAVRADGPRGAEEVSVDDGQAGARVRLQASLWLRAIASLRSALQPAATSSQRGIDVYRAPFASRKVSDETTSAFPLLKPPTGKSGAERQEFNLAGFPPKVEKDAEGN
eukprot:COSAG02_NODE_6263_length_3695_cov_1.870412_3_plen_135_part_01